MFSKSLLAQARRFLRECGARNFKFASAESCTGGLIAALLTEIAGSSSVVDRGFVTYSNEAKQELLGVPPAVLKKYGAVSEETAAAMTRGVIKNSNADIAVAVTGIAGPGGGSAEKPVGLVYIACAFKKKTIVKKYLFSGTRSQVRLKASTAALALAREQLTRSS